MYQHNQAVEGRDPVWSLLQLVAWCPGEAGIRSGQLSPKSQGEGLAGISYRQIRENSNSKADCCSLVSKRGLCNFWYSNRTEKPDCSPVFGS